MDQLNHDHPAVKANDSLIARAQERIRSERALMVFREGAGRDTGLCQRIVQVLTEWLAILLVRRSILLDWGRWDHEPDLSRGSD